MVLVQPARRARAPALCDYSLGPTAQLLARDRGSVDLQSMTRASRARVVVKPLEHGRTPATEMRPEKEASPTGTQAGSPIISMH
jgi:hypothetical protein